MKTLVICRHAKSDWSTGNADFDRPLNGRGKKDAPAMGQALRDYGFRPDLMISSPAARAKATALAVAKALEYNEDRIRWEQGIYDYGARHVMELVSKLPDNAETVMVFGHNPTLEEVCEDLLGMRNSLRMPTSAMCCIESGANHWEDFRDRRPSLQWLIIPKIIRS